MTSKIEKCEQILKKSAPIQSESFGLYKREATQMIAVETLTAAINNYHYINQDKITDFCHLGKGDFEILAPATYAATAEPVIISTFVCNLFP